MMETLYLMVKGSYDIEGNKGMEEKSEASNVHTSNQTIENISGEKFP